MSMGYYGNEAQVISRHKIEKFNLQSFKKLKEKTNQMKKLSEYEIYLVLGMADFTLVEYTYEELERYYDYYVDFQDEFKSETGMSIRLNYHDREEYGDIYDEVNGLFFELEFDEVYELTPEAKKLKDSLGFEMGHYVTYG